MYIGVMILKKFLKSAISALLCFVIMFGSFAIVDFTKVDATTNDKTADDAINWVNSMCGQTAGGGQCVDLVVAYYSYLGCTSPGGNGVNYIDNPLPSGWTRIQGGTPQKGDILVYSGTTSNKYGHVGIYESDYSSYHQNYNSVKAVQKNQCAL